MRDKFIKILKDYKDGPTSSLESDGSRRDYTDEAVHKIMEVIELERQGAALCQKRSF